MTIKRTITGLAALLTGMALAGPASADILTGEVYSVSNGDAYITMPDSTVARVPLETATFKVNGVSVPSSSLQVGQSVVADYTPVYGFQRYYHSDTATDGAKTVYIIQDADPNDVGNLEWDGRVYMIKR